MLMNLSVVEVQGDRGSNCDGVPCELYQKENETAERLFIFEKTKDFSFERLIKAHMIEDNTLLLIFMNIWI